MERFGKGLRFTIIMLLLNPSGIPLTESVCLPHLNQKQQNGNPYANSYSIILCYTEHKSCSEIFKKVKLQILFPSAGPGCNHWDIVVFLLPKIPLISGDLLYVIVCGKGGGG